ncbi:MAG: response regulator [Thermodesulfobacteriota bacterium]
MHNTTILLVKEADLVRDGLAAALVKARCEVLTAATSDEALLLLKKHHIDLILADLQLPPPTCLTLLSEARRFDPTIGFLCLKGYSEEDAVREALRRGADDFLLPPYDRHELYFRVTACLEKRALRRTAQTEKMLPVCSCCKKARPKASPPERDAWVDLETFLADQANITLTHGLCPQCAETVHAKIDQFGKQRR